MTDWYRTIAISLLVCLGIWGVGTWVNWPGLATVGKGLLIIVGVFGWGGFIINWGKVLWKLWRE